MSEAVIRVPSEKAGIVIGKGGETVKEINRRSGAYVEIEKSQRGPNAVEGPEKMFVIKGTPEQVQYAQQLIYEKITGVQGSQPPSSFFSGESMSPMHGYGSGGADGGGRSRSGGQSGAAQGAANAGYQQQQQQWGGYQQQGAWPQAADTKSNTDAWAAYYQSYYGQPQAGAAAAGAAAVTPGAAAATTQPTINPQTGQPDYSQAWVEYYRSLGMYEQADAILKQAQGGQTNGGAASATGGASAAQQPQQPQASAAPQQQQQPQNGGGAGGAGGAAGGWSGYGGYGNYGGGGASGYYKNEANGQ